MCKELDRNGMPRVVPVTLAQAKDFIARHHRHNKPPVGWKFGVGLRTGEHRRVGHERMSCGNDEMYGSTATDVLCLPCSVKHGLCRHCGGDLEMRTRRKDWPETPNVELTRLAEGESGAAQRNES